MTDTTAPRTAAGRALLELHAHRPVEGDEPGTPDNVWCSADDEKWPCPFAVNLAKIEAEAIEPLLALIRAAQRLEAAYHDADDMGAGTPATCVGCAVREAIENLDPSVRAAARKPE